MAVDVSSYQGAVDWDKVYAAGVRRAYVKWGEFYSGQYRLDVRALRNLGEARRIGVEVGVYFFAHPSRPPQESARWFLRSAQAQLQAGDLPPALDLEVQEGIGWPELNDWKAAWFAAVDGEVDCRCVFYSYRSFIDRMVLYPDRPVWGAAPDRGFVPPARWSIHQYSFTGRVDGISTAVDLDRFLKDVPRIGSGLPTKGA